MKMSAKTKPKSKCKDCRDMYCGHHSSLCDTCKKCLCCCCYCYICKTCKARILYAGVANNRSFCFSCYNCKEHCVCQKVKFVRGKLVFFSARDSHFTYNHSERFIAAEIEVASIKAGKDLDTLIKKWSASVVYDGSLPKSGFEINTSPANGDLFVEQITDICNSLVKNAATTTEQCGLHIHLDARDFNFYDIRRLVKVYAAIEPTLFLMVPEHRRNSKYCQPCADKYEKEMIYGLKPYKEVKDTVAKSVYNKGNSTEGRTNKYNLARRTALNLHSWFYRGTVECRLFEGTINAQDIIQWGRLWATIMDYTLNSTDEQIMAAMNKKKSLESLMKIIDGRVDIVGFVNARLKKYGVKKWKKKKIKKASALEEALQGIYASALEGSLHTDDYDYFTDLAIN